MQVTITEVTDYKVGQYGPSCKIHAGKDHWYVNEDAQSFVGKTVELSDIATKTSGAGRQYRVAKIAKVLDGAGASAGGSGSGNGHHGIAFDDYVRMAKQAHDMAKALEGDTVGQTGDDMPPVYIDRSAARVALVNTAMIAFTNGKISLDLKDDDIPF